MGYISSKGKVLSYENQTLIMGILNVTPDSFSDGGKYTQLDAALFQAEEMIKNGAHIIDIGGESTRPGFQVVPVEEEIERVTPIIERIASAIDCMISIDTYKAKTADYAIQAGAHIINDIWGAKADPLMATIAAKHDVPIILTHNREDQEYNQFFRDVVADLYESIRICTDAGVQRNNIILDPGIGFAKTMEQNLEMMRRLEDLVSIGYPVLLGTSRKSMIGNVLNLPVEERLEGSLATVCYGVTQGCQMVRVHDVKETARVTKMLNAMMRG